MPQVNVTFDIDANGILNVGAEDRTTGAAHVCKCCCTYGVWAANSHAVLSLPTAFSRRVASLDQRVRKAQLHTSLSYIPARVETQVKVKQ